MTDNEATEKTKRWHRARRIVNRLSERGLRICLMSILLGNSLLRSLLIANTYKD